MKDRMTPLEIAKAWKELKTDHVAEVVELLDEKKLTQEVSNELNKIAIEDFH